MRPLKLQLINPDLNDDVYDLIERAELDPEQEAKLERELSRQYHILTRDDRLETVARDIVRHFLLFMNKDGHTIKTICRYQQFRAVNRALERLRLV